MPASAPVAPDFELLFAALPAPYAVLAPDGAVLALNAALAALLPAAADAAALTGQPLAALRAALGAGSHVLAPDGAWGPALPAAGAGTAAVLAPEWAAGTDDDPARRYWEATLQPVPAPAGGVRHLLLCLLDVSAPRRVAAAQGRQTEQQLRDILWQSPALLATLEGPEHRYAFTNPGYDALVGRRARLGRPVAECLPELAAQGFVARLDEVYRTGEPYVGRETPVLIQDPATGQEREHHLDFTYQARCDARGLVTGILVFVVDVTARVAARRQADALQAERHAQDQRLHRLTESLPLITYLVDGPGAALYLSPQWYAYTGQNEAQALGHGWACAVHPDDLPAVTASWAAAQAARQPWQMQLRYRRADGAYRWHLGRAVPEQDPATGELRRWYGTSQDIHELLDLQGALQRRDQQLGEILRQAPAIISVLDGPEHRYVFLNDRLTELVGDRAQLGRSVAECLPEAVEQNFIALLDRVYRTGEPHVAYERQGYVADPAGGSPREVFLDFTYQPLSDAQGRITGLLGFTVDVTARVRARQQAAELQAQVQRRDQQLRLLTEALPQMTFIVDEQVHFDYLSPQWYAYTGQDPAADVAASWADFVHPDDLPVVGPQLARALAEGTGWHHEMRLRRHDGQYRWHLSQGVPDVSPDAPAGGPPRPTRWFGATTDIDDERRVQQALDRARADFAALADNIAQLAWMADPTGYIFWYNQQWYDYTGSDLATMQGWGWMQVHDPALAEGVNARYTARIQAGQVWEDTFPLRGRDGQYRWFLSRARPVRDPATGDILRWFGTNTDVTELRALQQQLRESEQELRLQAESIPQQIWTAGPDGVVDFYNHRTAAYTGEPMEQHGAAHGPEAVHPADRPVLADRWAAAVAAGRYYEAEFRLRRYDGQYRWFLAQAQPRRAPGGAVLRWYGTNTDIHELHELADALARREGQFRFLAESLPQVVWTSSGVGGNDYISQRWFDYTGLAPADTGDVANWAAVMHPDDVTTADARWAHCVATGEFFEVEYRFRRRDGVYRWFLGQARAQRDPAGHILQWFGSCTDIDDQKRAQQQLESQNARLLRLNEDLDSFVYTASHDLKQPINNMAGIFEELTRTAYFRDPDAIRLITYFERALAQIFATIDDLGAVVQGQRQQQEVPAEAVALAPLVAEVLGSLDDQMRQTGAAVDVDLATCPVVTFVRPNLQSVLFNLLGNSLKYAAPGRSPRLRLSCAPDAVTGRPVLTVEDNGLGIDLERYGPQLFQLFRRFHPHVEGTGMGLYLVNRIVQNHGGRLEVASVVGEGTTFTVYL